MKQTTFASLAWKGKGKVTRRERFLGEMDAVIPWRHLNRLIEPHYPKAGNVVMFTVDRAASKVWPYLKDFNLWMNSYGYYWPGVLGDLYDREERDFDQKRFPITIKKPGAAPQDVNCYQLLSVIPEYLIIMYQPIIPGDTHCGVSPGIHVFMLNEHDGKTTVTITMEHATRTPGKTEEEALAPWHDIGQEVHRFWRDIFVPELRALVTKAE